MEYAGAQYGELQLKLSDAMRLGGWSIVPKRANAMETSHFAVRASPPPCPYAAMLPTRSTAHALCRLSQLRHMCIPLCAYAMPPRREKAL